MEYCASKLLQKYWHLHHKYILHLSSERTVLYHQYLQTFMYQQSPKTFRLDLHNQIDHASFSMFPFYLRMKYQNIVPREKSLHRSMNKQKLLRQLLFSTLPIQTSLQCSPSHTDTDYFSRKIFLKILDFFCPPSSRAVQLGENNNFFLFLLISKNSHMKRQQKMRCFVFLESNRIVQQLCRKMLSTHHSNA